MSENGNSLYHFRKMGKKLLKSAEKYGKVADGGQKWTRF